MAAHSFMEINGHLMLACREDHLPDLAALFTETELQQDAEHYGYLSTVRAVRDRLQLHGFTSGRAYAELDQAVSAWHAMDPLPQEDELGVEARDTSMIIAELAEFLNSSDEFLSFELPQDVEGAMDARSILRVALDCCTDDGQPVRYNLDDLERWKLLSPGTPITEHARNERLQEIATDAPLVILTEGSSDSQLLTQSIELTHPYLVGFLHFMDFGSGAEGSASNLAKLVNSFIGAGIANRVLVLADNDTAAHDALAALRRKPLPSGYRVCHYPSIPLLREYPTLGPQLADPVPMDVNGKAGSLEMYLGRDILTEHGELIPVQWMGYIDRQKSYQGAIAPDAKRRVQDAFREKVRTARVDADARARQDWSGVDAIVEVILGAFEDWPHVPAGERRQ